MDADRPASGEELNPGAPTEPRQAATVIVLRDGADGLEVLLLRRNPASRFMGGAWVFPGGAVDPGDASHRAAAVREVEEEAGLVLPDPAALIRFSRWITPKEIAIRFDTHFFLAPAPPGQEARADGQEMVDLGWYTPGRRAGGAAPRRAGARVPDDQAPRAARALHVRGRADRLGRGPRGRRRRAAGADARRDRPCRATWRTGIPVTSPKVSARNEHLAWQAKPFTVIGVPIDSVGHEGGTELAPAAVRALGLPERIGATDRGDLDVRIREHARDPATGVVGLAEVLAVTVAVRAAVRDAVAAGERPLVLGGCCGLVPGALAGLRDAAGPLGVAYVDGHVDVYDGRTSPTGEAADMPMGVAFGRGPEPWVRAAGGASTAPERVVVLGARDPEEAEDIAALLAGELAALEVLGPAELRAAGPAAAAQRAADRLGGGRFWLHLDVDVLDEVAMPATDYLMPGGLEWDELAALMGPLAASPALAGVSLGCVNPEKDPAGEYTRRTCDLLAAALSA